MLNQPHAQTADHRASSKRGNSVCQS
jgi:hypothetical protein